MAKCDCGHPCENYPHCIDFSDVDYWKCPRCGNECSAQEGFESDNAPLCNRCPDGEYTEMDPVWSDPISED